MRLSTDESRDEELAVATIGAALEGGITVFDTAHAYGRGESESGHNERLLSEALRGRTARVVTKGGMSRAGGGWVPDGRAKTLRADCEASLAALDGLPIDLYLIHAPDPRTPWSTSVRALARLADDGLVERVGLANVNRAQLDEALELAPIAAVQIALSVLDDSALRGGVVTRCEEAGLQVIAHSPLGGPRRVARLARHEALREVAATRGATPAEVALAWLLDLSPNMIAIPGARRPETARSAARAATLELKDADRAVLAETLGATQAARPARSRTRAGSEVVLVMGVPGAGKSRVADEYVARGYRRLNRDERGGTLRELAAALDDELSSGVQRLVLDNTYLTRASRSYVVEVASRHASPARCIWLDTPLAQAQVNLVDRLLERFGALPSPEELAKLARSVPGVLAPTRQMRAFRELERPSVDEGFAGVEQVPFLRTWPPEWDGAGVFVAAPVLSQPGWELALGEGDRAAPHLIYDWSPHGEPEELATVVARLTSEVTGPVENALCPHPAGPPICWCRPPLPGLPLAFARAHGVDPSRSIVVGTGPAHRTLATTLGARYVAVPT